MGRSQPNGPHAASIEAHTHHAAGSAGNECVNCHMPKIEQEMGDIERSQPYFSIRAAERDGAAENSERLQRLPLG